LRTYVIDSADENSRRSSIQLNGEHFQVTHGWAVYVPNAEFSSLEKHHNRLARIILGRDLTQGEVGVSLAHQSVYKDHLARPEEWALVLEDDAVVYEVLALTQIKGAIALLDSRRKSHGKACVVLLGHDPRLVFTRTGHLLTKQRTIPTGTFGYLINKSASQKLAHNHTVNFLADWPFESIGVDFYVVNPQSISFDRSLQSAIEAQGQGLTREQANSQRDGMLLRLSRVRSFHDLRLVWHFVVKRGIAFSVIYPLVKRAPQLSK
jgi:GR25 family glycosyltransferase involved in LPS biosynthesis